MSDSLWPHELHNARLLCLSPSPGVSSNLCPLSQWHHPTISSSVPSSPPAFNLSQHQSLFQRVSSSHSATVLPMNIQGWFPLELIDWFDLLVVQGTLKSSPEQYFKSLNLQHLAFFKVQLSHPHMATSSITSWQIEGEKVEAVGSRKQHLTIPAMIRNSTDKLLPTREIQLSLGVQGFYWIT